MDKVGEIAAGVTGFAEETDSGRHIVAISSNLPGEGMVSLYLNDLPDDRRVMVHDVGNPIIRDALLRRGFNKQSLLPGTVITVEGYQAKDGANRANGRDITYQDVRKLFVGSSGIGAPDERPER